MSLDLPASLSPSKVSTFTDCALAFRFSSIDKLPEPPSVPATKGTLVHSALELLFCLPSDERTLSAGLTALDQAMDAIRTDPEFSELHLDAKAEAAFLDDAERLVRRYFDLEDPRTIVPIGIELKLEATIGDLRLRGIIDRLELDADGRLVVTDYKTGRVPRKDQLQNKLGGVYFYALLCERIFGQRPAKVQLLYLTEPTAIVTVPTEQSIRGLERKVTAIWSAVERACATEDFRPKPSKLCDWCAFQAFCPAFGGNPDDAKQAALIS
ncbi:MAG: PD-(D/E)XK nuclease family protein [Actinomycetes bacterium]